MPESNEQYAYFAVTGSFDPDEITARVGISPTEYWRQGDVNPQTRSERTFSRWCLCSRLDHPRELEEHIHDVFAQLDANPAGFQEISQEFGGCMQLVAYFHTGYPGLSFDRDITERLARYSLGVDFDFYWLASEPSTGPE